MVHMFVVIYPTRHLLQSSTISNPGSGKTKVREGVKEKRRLLS